MESDLSRAISQLRNHPTYIDLSFEGRTLQLCSDQITVCNIARTFRLIPQTIILVSESGTVAIPDGESGAFPDLDSFLTWTVEGDKARSGSSSFLTGSTGPAPSAKERWKPQPFSRKVASAASSGGTSSAAVGEVHTLVLKYMHWHGMEWSREY